jgi:4-amino-4-deoxy-L-arabinose transferase-like glycosyltransferase
MVFRGEAPALRFLWCWAIGPILFFSLFKGKHHHYMLSCMAPAAVIAAYGARWCWVWAQSSPDWLRRPWLSLPLLGIPGVIAMVLLRAKMPGPDWVIAAWMSFWIVVCWTSWWAVGRPDGRLAFTGFCAIVIGVQCVVYEYRTAFAEEYTDDVEFIHRVPAYVTSERPLFVLGECDPLNPSWPLFYLNGQGRLLHNNTYLLDEQITTPQVLVVCRQRYLCHLEPYGTTELLAQSKRARYERSADERYSLYALTFYLQLQRVPANVRMTPLQATGRAEGPFLGQSAAPTAQTAQ